MDADVPEAKKSIQLMQLIPVHGAVVTVTFLNDRGQSSDEAVFRKVVAAVAKKITG